MDHKGNDQLGLKPHHSTPTNNFLTGDWKSYEWNGPSHYIPSERQWQEYHMYRYLPMKTRPDAIDFQREDDWVRFTRSRDSPSGIRYHHMGIQPSGYPKFRKFGYRTVLPSMPSRKVIEEMWPKVDGKFRVAHHPRGEYYGYYHENLDRCGDLRPREVPTSLRIHPCDIPTIIDHPRNLLFGKTTFSEDIANKNTTLNFNSSPTCIYRTIDQPF